MSSSSPWLRKASCAKATTCSGRSARMLGDWRARALVNGFADQWLQIRNIYEVSPDPNLSRD